MMPNLHQKAQKVYYLHHCRKLEPIRCHKGAGTKMHKCLIGMAFCFGMDFYWNCNIFRIVIQGIFDIINNNSNLGFKRLFIKEIWIRISDQQMNFKVTYRGIVCLRIP